jgi:hypothetical protein
LSSLPSRQKPIFLFLSRRIDGTDDGREDNTVDSLYDIVSPTWKAWCVMFLFFPSSYFLSMRHTLQNHSRKKKILLQKSKTLSACSNLNRFWWVFRKTTTNQFSPNFIVGGRFERERRWEKKGYDNDVREGVNDAIFSFSLLRSIRVHS